MSRWSPFCPAGVDRDSSPRRCPYRRQVSAGNDGHKIKLRGFDDSNNRRRNVSPRRLRACFDNFPTPLFRGRMVPPALNGTICYCLISEKLLILPRTPTKKKKVRKDRDNVHLIDLFGRMLTRQQNDAMAKQRDRMIDGDVIVLFASLVSGYRRPGVALPDPPCCNTHTAGCEGRKYCVWRAVKPYLIAMAVFPKTSN